MHLIWARSLFGGVFIARVAVISVRLYYRRRRVLAIMGVAAALLVLTIYETDEILALLVSLTLLSGYGMLYFLKSKNWCWPCKTCDSK